MRKITFWDFCLFFIFITWTQAESYIVGSKRYFYEQIEVFPNEEDFTYAIEHFIQKENVKYVVAIADWPPQVCTRWIRLASVSNLQATCSGRGPLSLSVVLATHPAHRIGVLLDTRSHREDISLLLEAARLGYAGGAHAWMVFIYASLDWRTRLKNIEAGINSDVCLVRCNQEKKDHNALLLYKDGGIAKNRSIVQSRHIIYTVGGALGLTLLDSELDVLPRNNMYGVDLLVHTVTQFSDDRPLHEYLRDKKQPYTDSLSKVGYGVVQLYADYLNFTIVLRASPVWGGPLANGTYTGLVGELGARKADLGGTSIWIVKARLSYVASVAQVWKFSSGFIFIESHGSARSDAFLLPLSHGAWLCAGCTGVVLATALAFAPRAARRRGAPSIGETVFAVNATICQQGGQLYVRGWASGVLVTVVLIWGLVMEAHYSAGTLAALVREPPSRVRDVRALADERSLDVFVEEIAYAHDILFNNPTGDLRYLVNRRGRRGLTFTSAAAGAVCLSRGSCALHTEPATAYALLAHLPPARACRLRLLPVIPPTVLAVPAPRGSPNLEPLKVAGRWVQETGLQYREASTWRALRPACATDGSRRAASLGDVAPLLVALAISYVLAALIAIAECLVRRCKVNKKKTSDSDVGNRPYIA